MPIRHIFVCDTRCNIEHNDSSLALNVVPISQTTELFLTCCVPYTKLDGSIFCIKYKRVNFDTESGNILLLEFTRFVSLNESGLSSTTIADKYNLD
mgnify:CR=1 FL=1